MYFFFGFIFFTCFFLLLHSYVLYPLSLYIIHALGSRERNKKHEVIDQQYQVSCVTAVYNEANIIEKKIESLMLSDYPSEKINYFIGSDASVDGSNEIITRLQKEYTNIRFYPFENRRGKTNVINDLIEEAFKLVPRSDSHIVLFTDANVILSSDTIRKLLEPFVNPGMAVVDSRIIQKNVRLDGSSKSESQYMSFETKLKYLEGNVLGCMMGAFGGCFAIRSSFLDKIPSHLIVDDFFITMNALIKNGRSSLNPEAICFEGIPNQMHEEFKRKSRISVGNFQNLALFYIRLFVPPFKLAYAFFSHKFIRWVGPFLLLGMYLSSLILFLMGHSFFEWVWYGLNGVFIGIPFFEYLLFKCKIHLPLLRAVRYFMYMNLALLNGFIIYCLGKQLVTWQPPKRSLMP